MELSQKESFAGDIVKITGKRKRESRPKIVLEEDDYLNALGAIIKRDFFPDLTEFDDGNDSLTITEHRDASAHEAHTNSKKRSAEFAQRALHATPRIESGISCHPMLSIGSTPCSSLVIPNSSKLPPYDINMSVDEFLDRYTSEDNASFHEIINSINERRQAVFNKLHVGNEDKESKNIGLITDIDGKIHRPAAIESWKSNPKNALMYYPDTGESILDDIQTRGQPKAIVHVNTRINLNDVKVQRSSSPSLSHLEMRITGKMPDERYNSTDDTPRVNGYSIVGASPTRAEMHRFLHKSESNRVSDLENETPSNTGRGFKIPETPRRDLLGQRLSELASRNLRAQKAQSVNPRRFSTPNGIPRMQSPMTRASMLSPAAQKLLLRSNTSSTSNSLRKNRSEWDWTPKTSK